MECIYLEVLKKNQAVLTFRPTVLVKKSNEQLPMPIVSYAHRLELFTRLLTNSLLLFIAQSPAKVTSGSNGNQQIRS